MGTCHVTLTGQKPDDSVRNSKAAFVCMRMSVSQRLVF